MKNGVICFMFYKDRLGCNAVRLESDKGGNRETSYEAFVKV